MKDATGNVMANYKGSGSGTSLTSYTLRQLEENIYGANRIGIMNRESDIKASYTAGNLVIFQRGTKNYELSNHLGNVLTTVTDKKIGVDNGSDGLIDYYLSGIVTANDYCPFGMAMVGRTFSSSSQIYRYGFNGQEKSDEIKGVGNRYTAEFWEYGEPQARARYQKPPMLCQGSFYFSALTFSSILYYFLFNTFVRSK